MSFHSSGQVALKKSPKKTSPINIQPPISFHSSGQADIGEAAMWSRSAWFTQNYSFDTGLRCPIAVKVVQFEAGRVESSNG
jgi:hypothetical protein